MPQMGFKTTNLMVEPQSTGIRADKGDGEREGGGASTYAHRGRDRPRASEIQQLMHEPPTSLHTVSLMSQVNVNPKIHSHIDKEDEASMHPCYLLTAGKGKTKEWEQRKGRRMQPSYTGDPMPDVSDNNLMASEGVDPNAELSVAGLLPPPSTVASVSFLPTLALPLIV